jgi:fermentation-respiration switch protein FrsA (DUF1100 family)
MASLSNLPIQFAPDARWRGEKRRLRWIIFGVTALALACLVVTAGESYYVAWQLIHPAPKAITQTPGAYALTYRAVQFPSAVDRVQLSGWLIPAPSPADKLVIEAHGYQQNRAADAPALPVANALHKSGYSVLMFDFRAEGKSHGSEVTVGLFEQRDLLGAITYAQKLGYRHIGVIGYSMGGSTALEVAAADPAIEAIVADSPFANLYRYLQRHMSEWTHLPNWPFTPEILFELRLFNHIDAHRVDPEQDMTGFRQRPVLLIAGTADHIVPMSNSEALYKALRHDKSAHLWLVPGAKHVGAYTADPEQYLSRVIRFFGKSL